jgi:adenine-specific DNA methylase
LLPDPSDELCPGEFKQGARRALDGFYRVDPNDQGLRKALLDFIGDFSNWESSRHRVYLTISKRLIQAAYPNSSPTVADTFAGGGSIPFEAIRLGCSTLASDLNPVATLALKVLLETAPRLKKDDIDLFMRLATKVLVKASNELRDFYPTRPDGSSPIAYFWARTIMCEAPNCGGEIPLVRSWWLAKTPRRKVALSYQIRRPAVGLPPELDLQVVENPDPKNLPSGTIIRGRAVCPFCGAALDTDRVKGQLRSQSGGSRVIFDADGKRIGGARLLAVLFSSAGRGKQYVIPSKEEDKALYAVQQKLQRVVEIHAACADLDDIAVIPDETLPPRGTLGFRVQNYGMKQWSDLYSTRQLMALTTFSRFISDLGMEQGCGVCMQEILALAADRLADFNSALSRWASGRETSAATFGRHALPMLWDFCETNPISGSTGSWQSSVNILRGVLEYVSKVSELPGTAMLADARNLPLPDESVDVWFIDPPYYDAVPYGDLSDFFFVWLKRMLRGHPMMRDPFDPQNQLTPKGAEIVQDSSKTVEGRPKDSVFFEVAMAAAFREGRRILQPSGVGCVVFAHKTTEGWEALISAMIRAGLSITASWPIATERSARLRSQASAALATSVHLVCRPRPDNAPVGDWAEVLRELPKRVGHWMERLQGEGIRGADLVFACIGPALEIFSRYSKVESADGREVKLDEYLVKVWEVVGRTALEQVLGTAEAQTRNGAAGALEEDARLTALFLWTLQATNGQNGSGKEPDEESGDASDDDEEEATPRAKAKGFSLVFDVARRFAQPLGIDLPKWEGRVIETKKGVIRLMAVSERAKQLFGDEGADTVADWIEREPRGNYQMLLFPESEKVRIPKILGRKSGRVMRDLPAETASQAGVTTLDRVHAAMLLQAGGQANALRALIKSEQDRGPDFLRLANALSALYPTGSEEKRLLDAMLVAVPR